MQFMSVLKVLQACCDCIIKPIRWVLEWIVAIIGFMIMICYYRFDIRRLSNDAERHMHDLRVTAWKNGEKLED